MSNPRIKIDPVHHINSYPEGKSAKERGLRCGASYTSDTRASSYFEQVTCEDCRNG
jgi:hypothetical protein